MRNFYFSSIWLALNSFSAYAQITPIPNPDLLPNCPYNIIFVLDESGSIIGSSSGTSNINSQVRNGARDLINALSGTGSRVAVIEFNSNARRAVIGGTTAYQTVNAAYITAFNNYISRDYNSSPSGFNYDPEDYSCPGNQCYTNWEAAFNQVQSVINTEGLAQLVVFFTDGMPTAYINGSGSVTLGTDTATARQALLEAVIPANAVKSGGTHIFVVGIPNPNLPETNVQQISGPDKYPTVEPDFTKADYSVSTSQTLQHDLGVIATLICRVDLSLTKTANKSFTCAGDQIVFTLTLLNDGPDNAGGIEVEDMIPSGYTYINDNGGSSTGENSGTVTWNIGDLNAGSSVTLLITIRMNATGNLKNTAQVTACSQTDLDSAPGNDDGDQSEDDEDAATVSRLVRLTEKNISICQGESYYAGGALQTESGIYLDTFIVSFGCDSIVTTFLGIAPSAHDSVSAVICDDEHYFIGGAWQNVSGTYHDTLLSSRGCDSLITVFLTVIPHKTKYLRVPICQGDSIYVGGYFRKESGPYYDTFVAANGCDSILVTIVVIPQCDDLDLCTNNYCDAGGCYFTAISCADGDSCTQDVCSGGVCSHLSVLCMVDISGIIRTETGIPVPGVTVHLLGNDSLTHITGSDGFYSFTVAAGGSYTIAPVKTNDVTITSGITTLDYHLIRAHVLGAAYLGTPYKVIAADMNFTGVISAADALMVRSLVLGNLVYPSNRLWQFASSDFPFPSPLTPFPFDKTRSYINLNQPQINQDFIGIKMGDVNNSWNPSIP